MRVGWKPTSATSYVLELNLCGRDDKEILFLNCCANFILSHRLSKLPSLAHRCHPLGPGRETRQEARASTIHASMQETSFKLLAHNTFPHIGLPHVALSRVRERQGLNLEHFVRAMIGAAPGSIEDKTEFEDFGTSRNDNVFDFYQR